jgi:hypothetical protein
MADKTNTDRRTAYNGFGKSGGSVLRRQFYGNRKFCAPHEHLW